VDLEPIEAHEEEAFLYDTIQRHLLFTHSARAAAILEQWPASLRAFVKVMPREYKKALAAQAASAAANTLLKPPIPQLSTQEQLFHA
jgi:glutamate synthase domain-containing protein 3